MPKLKNSLIKKEKKSKEKRKKPKLFLVSPHSVSLPKEKTKKEFKKLASIISHDLQSPLRTLLNFTDLLKEILNKQKNAKALKYIKFISENTDRIHQQLEGLKEYLIIDQIQSREIKPEESLQILKEVLLMFKDQIQIQKAEIQIPSFIPKIFSDPESLKTIFFQLIDNAFKFTEKKPSLSISVHQENNQFIKFQIQDNGISIEKEFFEKIFIPFQSLHPINKYKGVGLGLSLVKKAVEANGGKVGLTSKKEEGSQFFFTLPSIPIPLD